jgi:hypothetical protein
VLRLWPEYMTLGVFPGACWLQRSHGATTTEADLHRPAADADLLDAVDALLAQHAGKLSRGARVEVIVSDSLGLTTSLPWQDQLSSASQVRSYARMLLEAQGMLDNAAWAVEGGFRHFGANGMGVALREDWLARLTQIVAAHGLRLRGVLPVSAVAYWQFNKLAARGQSLMVLGESKRLTALVYRNKRLHAIDAQPVLNGMDESGERLCRRLNALHGDMTDIVLWSPTSADLLKGVMSRCTADVDVSVLPLGHWRRN